MIYLSGESDSAFIRTAMDANKYRVTENAQTSEKTLFLKLKLTKDLNKPQELSVINEDRESL